MVKGPWQSPLALILDKISIISLRLLVTIDMHLNQTKSKTNNDIAVLDDLSLIIVMGDFYQFLPVNTRSLWNRLITKKKIYGQSI